MRDFKQMFVVAKYDFRKWKHNPRIIVTFVLAMVLCLMLSDKAITFAHQYGMSLQITEVFIWTFGDANSVMISSFLLILLFADIPFITTGTPYLLYRTKRKVWVGGQIIYLCATTMLFVLFLFICTCLICAPDSFLGNQWSETAAMIGYSGIGMEVALPASVKVMEGVNPYQCAMHIFLLMMGYSVLMATLLMVFNLRKNAFLGILSVFGVNMYGLMLNPEFFMDIFHIPEQLQYKANLAVGWFSPLNHATYYMHNFGYDRLPRLWMSYLIFIILIVFNIWKAVTKMKRYEFQFVQTEE